MRITNISRNRGGIDLIFCKKININIFYKLIQLFMVAIARHAQSTWNDRFAMLFWHFKIEGKDEVDFLYTDRHQIFLKVSFAKSLQYLKNGQVYWWTYVMGIISFLYQWMTNASDSFYFKNDFFYFYFFFIKTLF